MNPRAAFSLVELLCAIFILGIGLAGLTRGVTTALSASKEAERNTSAALLAAGRIEMLRADEFLIRGTEEGDFGDEFAAYRWRESITETSTEGLFDVRVSILDSDTGEVIYNLDTRFFENPESSEEEESRGTTNRAEGGVR